MNMKQIQNLLQYLGYYQGIPDGVPGNLTRSGVERFQKDFGITVDGDPGSETQRALLQAVAQGMPVKNPTAAEDSWWEEIEFFGPKEVACKCGGKYCGGFPHAVQPLLMGIADRARRWSGHPIQVISGLRCETWNRLHGGVENSQHKFGEALDVYFCGKDPDTALAWLQSQPEVRYAYRIAGCDNIHFDIQPVGR